MRGSIPTAGGGWWAPLPAACPQSQPPGRAHTAADRGTSSTAVLPSLLATAPAPPGCCTELVGSLHQASSHLCLSLGCFSAPLMHGNGSWSSPDSTSGDASEGGSPGSRGDPPTSSRDPWAWFSRLCTAAQTRRDERLGGLMVGSKERARQEGKGEWESQLGKTRSHRPALRQALRRLSPAGCHQQAVTSRQSPAGCSSSRVFYQKGNRVNAVVRPGPIWVCAAQSAEQGAVDQTVRALGSGVSSE